MQCDVIMFWKFLQSNDLKTIACDIFITDPFRQVYPFFYLYHRLRLVSVQCDGLFDGSCYRVETGMKRWASAGALCLNWGGHLAIITSQAENQFVSDLVQG